MPDTGQPPATPTSGMGGHIPSQREKIIARMLATATELKAQGLDVRIIPIGSDLNDCRGAVTELAVTNPTAPSQGHVRIKRHPTNLVATATWEQTIPLRATDASIKHIATTITHILTAPTSPHPPDPATPN